LTYLTGKNLWIDPALQPVCVQTKTLGHSGSPGYEISADPKTGRCARGMVLLTNRDYAIEITAACTAAAQNALEQVRASFKFIPPVKAVPADCPSKK
jgi:hypothetical protein